MRRGFIADEEYLLNLNASQVRDLACTALDELKGQDVICLDVGDMTSIADYMVVATGTSTRHVKALADEVVRHCKEAGVTIKSMEGAQQAEWVLLDLGDVIVHVMQGATRKLYDLESLWNLSPVQD